MCTLIAAVGQFGKYPLVIAANRDEALDRPSSPPRSWEENGVRFLAPRDELAGGTWLGLNEHGLFVGITNRFGATKHPDRRSRGALVTDALQARSVEALHAQLASLSFDTYNAFHLFYADATGAAGVTWSDGDRLAQERYGPGLYVITERSFGAADTARADHVRALWPEPLESGDPDLERIEALLRRHDDGDPLAATCIHVPVFNYGTRSSLVLLLAPSLADSRWAWAEGSPCQHRHEAGANDLIGTG